MSFLVFGSINIDKSLTVDHIVREGETIAAASLQRSAGGKGANQAASLGLAGESVYLAGKTGRDALFILETLNGYGVDTSRVVVTTSCAGEAIIQVDRRGENSIVLYPGENRNISRAEVDRVLDGFSSDDALVLQNEINQLDYIIKKGKERGLSIVLNPSPFDQAILSLPLSLVDLFVVNRGEAIALCGNRERECEGLLYSIREQYPNSSVLLTDGRNGAYFIDKDGVIYYEEARECEALDTTGAGDTFLGYFLSSLKRCKDYTLALKRATAAASLSIARRGAMVSFPKESEVDSIFVL